jgi:hypothetical protein
MFKKRFRLFESSVKFDSSDPIHYEANLEELRLWTLDEWSNKCNPIKKWREKRNETSTMAKVELQLVRIDVRGSRSPRIMDGTHRRRPVRLIMQILMPPTPNDHHL